MRHSPRLFPHTIMRRRTGPDVHVHAGEYEPGAVVETPFRANVQPVKLEDDDQAGGAQYSRALKVYIPESDALAAAFGDAQADHVVYDALEYVVVESQSWPGSHTRATLLRES